MKHALFALLGLSLAFPAGAAEDAVVDVTYGSRARLQALADRFQHIDVRKDGVARVVASADDVAALRADGYRVAVDATATAKLAAATAAVASAKRIPEYACYRTVEETYDAMDTLASAHPALARVVDLGPSWTKSRGAGGGYELRALVLGNEATDAVFPDKPALVVTSAIHAREYATAELMTRFAEELVAEYGIEHEATWLLDNFRFHFVLQSNPDGRKRAETGVLWRKNVNDTAGACNAGQVGVDLNRNFPWRWGTVDGMGFGASTADPCAETYRGTALGSEPETQALVRYVAGDRGPDGVYRGGVLRDRAPVDGTGGPADYRGLYIDVHSFGRLVMWPWGDTSSPAPNALALRTLGERLAHFGAYLPQQSNELYLTDGATDDHFYATLGAPAYTFEIGNTFFEDCTDFAFDTHPANRDALRYAARTLPAPYELGGGPTAKVYGRIPATLVTGTPLPINAIFDDDLSGGARPAVASAAAYVDVPPWQPGATAIPLPLTGRSVIGSIPTTSIAPGVHTVYVQGTAATGARGVADAFRIEVLATPLQPQTGWYWNAAEPGRGWFIERNASDRLFMAAFHYASAGSATWFSAQGTFANGYAEPPTATFRAGQTLTGPYVAPVDDSRGTGFYMEFSSEAQVEVNAPDVRALTRFPFTGGTAVEPPRAGAPESGWWWNPAEPGRGFAIEFQGDSLFMAGFMYADGGDPTWYVTSGPLQSPTRYTGTWLAFRDGQSAVAPYRTPVRAPDAGGVTLEFDDARTARLTLPDGRTIPLVRFGF